MRCLAGILTLSAAYCLPATANAATITTANVPGTLSFDVTSNPLGGIAGCRIVPGPHSYGTTSFTAANAATYSFTATALQGAYDSFLALYKNNFDPARPTDNLVGCNDDASPGSYLPKFVADLEAGTTYVMVATTFIPGAFTGSVTFAVGVVPGISLDGASAAVGATGRSMVATSDSPMPISYASANPNVATIDPATGALTLLSMGFTTITATQAAQADPLPFADGMATARLTVTAVPPNLSLVPVSAAVGTAGQAMVASSDSPMPISYASSDPDVATIEPATGALTLLSVGTTTITASQAAQADPLPFAAGVATALLKVTAVPVAAPPNISLDPASAAVGATGQSMVATSDSPMPISYTSSDPDVATIDPATGALTLLSVGTTTITATQAAQADPLPFAEGMVTALLTVTAAPVATAPQPIPTLSQWGVVLMAALLALSCLGRLRRRRT